MRLIDADALKEKLDELEPYIDCDENSTTWILSDEVYNAVDSAPTVEPEKEKESELIKAYTKGFDTGVETVKTERPQGEWIHLQAIGDYKCSICGCENLYKYANEHERWIKTNSNFCPNCGAKMKGGEKNGL